METFQAQRQMLWPWNRKGIIPKEGGQSKNRFHSRWLTKIDCYLFIPFNMHFTIKIKQLSSGTMLDRRNATIKIGDFSYFQNRVLGKGATGWVFEGTCPSTLRLQEQGHDASCCQNHQADRHWYACQEALAGLRSLGSPIDQTAQVRLLRIRHPEGWVILFRAYGSVF